MITLIISIYTAFYIHNNNFSSNYNIEYYLLYSDSYVQIKYIIKQYFYILNEYCITGHNEIPTYHSRTIDASIT